VGETSPHAPEGGLTASCLFQGGPLADASVRRSTFKNTVPTQNPRTLPLPLPLPLCLLPGLLFPSWGCAVGHTVQLLVLKRTFFPAVAGVAFRTGEQGGCGSGRYCCASQNWGLLTVSVLRDPKSCPEVLRLCQMTLSKECG